MESEQGLHLMAENQSLKKGHWGRYSLVTVETPSPATGGSRTVAGC